MADVALLFVRGIPKYCLISDGTIGVRFDHTNVNFHDCNGRCEKNRGYWLDRTQLKPLGAFIDGWEQTQIKRKKK